MKWIAENADMVLTVEQDDCYDNPRTWHNLGTMVCFHRRYCLGDDHSYGMDVTDFLKAFVVEHANAESVIERIKAGEWPTLKIVQDRVEKELWTLMYYSNYEKDWLSEFTFNTTCEFHGGMILEALVDHIRIENEGKYGWCDYVIDLVSDSVVVLPLYLYDHSIQSISTESFAGRAYHASWDSGPVGWVYCSKERFLKETRYTAEQLFNEGKAEEMLRNEVEVYDMYLRGDVYGFKLEKKVVCSCCNHVELERVNSCWGFYGRDFEKNGIADHVGDIELVKALEVA